MENLNLKRLASDVIPPEGRTLLVGPGKFGIRSHRRLLVTTDGSAVYVEPNVDTVIDTKSGSLAIDVLAPPVAIELWPIAEDAPAAPASSPESPAAPASSPEATPSE